jgi:hypothetical protein
MVTGEEEGEWEARARVKRSWRTVKVVSKYRGLDLISAGKEEERTLSQRILALQVPIGKYEN